MRLPLPGGQYAELRDRLTYQQARAVRAALLAVEADRAALVDLDMALVGAYLVSWNVTDLDGQSVPSDRPDAAPDDVIQAVAAAAIAAWKGTPAPKGMPAPSRTTRRARQ
jgi:hypothetical protein